MGRILKEYHYYGKILIMKRLNNNILRKLEISSVLGNFLGKRSNAMKIKFIAPKVVRGRVKCTVHRNGKLGFSQAAKIRLGINNTYYAKIGINEEDTNDKNLYMLLTQQGDEESFKVSKAGNYLYLNTRNLFDELHIDYKNKKIIFDIEEIQHDGMTLYKLIRREIIRNQ